MGQFVSKSVNQCVSESVGEKKLKAQRCQPKADRTMAKTKNEEQRTKNTETVDS